MANQYDIDIRQGSTFERVLTYHQPQLSVVPITGITKSGQALVTAAGHGIPGNWLVWIVGVAGMTQLNNQSEDLNNTEKAIYAYYVDANTMRLNQDTTRFSAYVSGGEMLYHPPVDLTSYTARMQIRSDVDSATIIQLLTTENGGIILGGTAGTVALFISATDTAVYTLDQMVYDIELISPTGVVTSLVYGNLSLSDEVTR